MTSSLVSLSSVDVPALKESDGFMPPWGYGLFAFCLFLLLFAFLWAFRNTAARYGSPKGSNRGQKH